LSKLKSM